MSPELLGSFASILEGLVSFFIQAKNKEHLVEIERKIRRPEEIQKTKALVAHRRQLCIDVYTEALKSGLNARQAISAANKALKEQGENWSSYYTVYEVVRSAGLLRGTDFYKTTRRKS